MKRQAINFEILFLINRHSSGKHVCKKKCNNEENCPFQLQKLIHHAKLFSNSLISINYGSSIKDFDSTFKVIPSKHFIYLNARDAFKTTKPEENFSTFSFFPLKHFN